MRKKRKIEGLVKESKSKLRKSLVYVKKSNMRSWKMILLITFLLGGFVAIYLSVFYKMQTSSNAATDATLYFSSTSVSTEVGQVINLTTKINPGTNEVGGVELDVSFDPAVLRLDSITKSNAFNLILSGPVINNAVGNGSIDVGLLTNPSTYISTISDVAVFSFTVLSPSSGSSVSFSSTSNASSHGEYVVANRIDAKVVVSSSGGIDTTTPTISITNPSNNSTVSGTVDLTATASDNVTVSRVEFYIDGSLKATDTSSPYSFSLDTKSLSNATHSLLVRAYDSANNSATSSVSFIINNEVSCTSFNYSEWNACQPDSTQTRTVLSESPLGCTGGNPIISQSCVYSGDPTAVICTRFKYSKWSTCVNSIKTRTVLYSFPAGCTGGSPVLSAACRK